MTTPPSKLLDLLVPCSVYTLRGVDGSAMGKINYPEAVREARAGRIEGVGGPNGRVKYLRTLHSRAIQEEVFEESRSVKQSSRGSINAVTGLGAYMQTLEGGKVWALCLCRSAGV